MDKLDIKNEMAQIDSKNRDFYDELTDEERKKFGLYVLNRWTSSVSGSSDLQHFYLVSTNERLNKHFFALSKHPKLQWLCATTVSPGMGNMRHNWISNKKPSNPVKKELEKLFPHMKDDEIELLAKITDKKDINEYLKELGKEKIK